MSQNITLDNTVEHVKWKSSSNAAAQDVTTVKLDGVTIWEKPDLDIELSSLVYNETSGDLTITVDKPALIDSWKYKIDNGTLSSAQTQNSAVVTGSVEGETYDVSIYGYRNGVLKGAGDLSTASTAEQQRRTGQITIPVSISIGTYFDVPQSGEHCAKLEYLGNRQWKFTSRDISDETETNGGESDKYAGRMYVLWEPGQMSVSWDKSKAGEFGGCSGSQTATHTYTTPEPDKIYIGYGRPPAFSSASVVTPVPTYTEASIVTTSNNYNTNFYIEMTDTTNAPV